MLYSARTYHDIVKMNVYFENFADEINSVITRSQKDNYTLVYTIQKAVHPHIQHYNGRVEESSMNTIFGMNLGIASADGYYIFGSTNRLHLPDFMSRLYQSLENLLKANSGHKFNSKNILKDLPTDKKVNLKYNSLENFDLPYINQLLHEIFNSINPKWRSEFDYRLKIEGNYSLWLAGNSKGGRIEHDDFFLPIVCEISVKENPVLHCATTDIIPFIDLRDKSFDFSKLLNKIEKYSEVLMERSFSKNSKGIPNNISLKKLSPEVIVLDTTLAHTMLYELISNQWNEINGMKIDAKYFTEDGDVGAEGLNLFQKSFFSLPLNSYRHIKVEGINGETDLVQEGIEARIDEIQKEYKVDRILFLSGNTSNTLNTSDRHFVFSPSVAMYVDKSQKDIVEINLLDLNIDDIDRVSLAGAQDRSVFNLLPHEMPFCIYGNETAILNIDAEKVKIL